jgi:hypothetical protein
VGHSFGGFQADCERVCCVVAELRVRQSEMCEVWEMMSLQRVCECEYVLKICTWPRRVGEVASWRGVHAESALRHESGRRLEAGEASRVVGRGTVVPDGERLEVGEAERQLVEGEM